MMKSIPELLTMLPKSSSPQIRFFLRGHPEPTNWGSWVISPTQSYWEHEEFGPFLITDVEKCQIRFPSHNASLDEIMKDNGFYIEETNVFSRDY